MIFYSNKVLLELYNFVTDISIFDHPHHLIQSKKLQILAKTNNPILYFLYIITSFVDLLTFIFDSFREIRFQLKMLRHTLILHNLRLLSTPRVHQNIKKPRGIIIENTDDLKIAEEERKEEIERINKQLKVHEEEQNQQNGGNNHLNQMETTTQMSEIDHQAYIEEQKKIQERTMRLFGLKKDPLHLRIKNNTHDYLARQGLFGIEPRPAETIIIPEDLYVRAHSKLHSEQFTRRGKYIMVLLCAIPTVLYFFGNMYTLYDEEEITEDMKDHLRYVKKKHEIEEEFRAMARDEEESKRIEEELKRRDRGSKKFFVREIH